MRETFPLKRRRAFLAVLWAAVFACALLLTGCAPVEADAPEEEGSGTGPVPAVQVEGDNISRIMSAMTLRQKIGQMFMIRPEVLGGSRTGLTEKGLEMYEDYPAGGFCLFADNIRDPQQLLSFTEQLHSLGERIHPVLTIDEEGGSVTRIASNRSFDVPRFPDMGRLSASEGTEARRQAAFESAQQIGSYLREYGIDLDFAPVADVNTNPWNPVIGLRAYSSDVEEASLLVAGAVEGFHAGGSGCCLKHWPGHGDTKNDTHLGSAKTEKDWEALLACEVPPFAAGIGAGADMIMVSHISAPSVTGSSEPASLSRVLISEKLRGELGWEGVVVTDAMEMGAVSGQYGPGEAAVLAIQAGADIVLMPSDYGEAFDAVLAAVESGEISMERISESVRRILRMKADLMAL